VLIWPTTATPCAGKSNATEAAIPAAKTRKAVGMAGKRFNNNRAAKAKAALNMEIQFQCDAAAKSAALRWKISDAGRLTPAMAGNCLMIMVMARPSEKPRRTGLATKPVRLPSLVKAASAKKAAVSRTTAVTKAGFPSGAMGVVAKIAARIAADDDVGAAMAKRLWPIDA